MSQLATLYKYTAKGQVQEWTIKVKDDYFWTEEGIQGGAITISKPTYCKAKNVGRSNATTPAEQATAEAKAKWQKKLDSGYNLVLTRDKKFFEPMLAHELSKYEKLLFTVPTFIQPKLDGLRAISQDNTLMSRNGKPFVVPHLYQDLFTLDGELYNHKYHDDFNKIVSLCKKQNPDAQELKEQEAKIQFWAYDLPDHKGKFSERYEKLKEILDADWMNFPAQVYINLVPTYEVKSQKDIDHYHDKFLSEGFEGSILRLDLGEYENKRSKQLLKKKDFIDEEFKIVGAEEGTGGRAGTIGFFIVELEDGKTCKSNVKGPHEYLAEVWKDKDKYIGTKATIKYFNRTPDNSLRFPYVIKLNREAYE
jgi:DNA ligase 1